MKPFYLCFALLCSTVFVRAQEVTISGYITDVASGESLINANIYETLKKKGTVSNVYGFYSLTLPPGQQNLLFSFVGYSKQSLDFNLQKDTVINIRLKQMADLDEITVHASKSNVERTQMSLLQLPVERIEKLPVILGEPDVLKVIQLLPGVQAGTEGTSGIYVRGGGADQNLFLLDGVPVYNASHLFGFFSVFNSNAVKTVNLYKGGFPARFGGRLSSVVDIRMKEGNDQEYKGEFSVGLISSRFSFEGPINKGKTAFIVSGRRTYIDVLAQPFIQLANKKADNEDINAGYYFYDLNAKINHRFSDRDRLFLSMYSGKDKAYDKSEFTSGESNYYDKYNDNLGWGNITSALRWNHVFGPKLFSNATLTYSKYNFDVESDYEYTGQEYYDRDYFRYMSGINDVTAKMDFDYYPGVNHSLKFGASNTWHTFKPGVNHEKTTVDDDGYKLDQDTTYGNQNIAATEFDAYLEDSWNITSRLNANIGLYFSWFNVQNTNYTSFQPRLAFRYLVSDNLSIKASYAKMSQYIHLLSSSTISLPTDLWLPTTQNVKPQNSEQWALGAAYKHRKGYEFSVEAFYKEMDNLIEYKPGATFSGVSEGWESKIETGKGWSYGAEFMVEKKTGKTTGWLGYTLSWSNRKFDNLNFGKTFPAKYDRRHDINLVLNHEVSKKFDIGLAWVYGTGNATTLGAQDYSAMLPGMDNYYSGGAITYYGGRNSYRMPAYHRLDLSMNFHKQKKRGVRTWTVGVYNAYSRQNPFYLYWGSKREDAITPEGEHYTTSKPALKQVSLFPFIPSVSYTFKF
ncbi:TonB-dependent receptor [uncultured Draconibacterium sp.]|uniref:TonB-dependent receptor n=1 Tax=uncultured Draconibacterium sp. TaxID=1573823 RepID=UPI0029C63212|nr:TonB-dependent receptor [uncultured Draconibacterium sp.]